VISPTHRRSARVVVEPPSVIGQTGASVAERRRVFAERSPGVVVHSAWRGPYAGRRGPL